MEKPSERGTLQRANLPVRDSVGRMREAYSKWLGACKILARLNEAMHRVEQPPRGRTFRIDLCSDVDLKASHSRVL